MTNTKILKNGLVCEVVNRAGHGIDFRFELEALREAYKIESDGYTDALIRLAAHFRAMMPETSSYIFFSDLQKLAQKAFFEKEPHDSARRFVRWVVEIETELEDPEGYSVVLDDEDLEE